MAIYLCYYIDKDFGTYCRKQTIPALMYTRQTDDLDHFRQGFLAQSFVCVCARTHFSRYSPHPLHTHTHTSSCPIAVCLPDTHHTSIQKLTLQNTNIWCCIPITENSGIRLGGPSLPTAVSCTVQA